MIYDYEVWTKLTKPCPFCGGRKIKALGKEYYNDNTSDSGAIRFECDNCGATLWSHPHTEGLTYNEAMRLAIKNWNRRATA